MLQISRQLFFFVEGCSERWIEDLEDKEWGYIRTKTPLMAKSDLYKISGHWDHYTDGMFVKRRFSDILHIGDSQFIHDIAHMLFGFFPHFIPYMALFRAGAHPSHL